MSIQRRGHGYASIEIEDPEERIHRRAQFLIYKVMERADCQSRKPCLRIRICRLKVKIGRRLTKLRKSMFCNVSETRLRVCSRLMSQFKTWKRLLSGGDSVIALPPLFT